MQPILQERARELRENREALTTLVRGLDEEALTTKGENSSWSPRNTVAHLVGAELSMLRMAKNFIAQTETKARPDFDLNFFNQRQQEKRAGQSLDELLLDWYRVQDALIELMETVTPEDLVKRGDHPREKNTTLANLFVIITGHEAEHIREAIDANA